MDNQALTACLYMSVYWLAAGDKIKASLDW